jgi:hypothetical protein
VLQEAPVAAVWRYHHPLGCCIRGVHPVIHPAEQLGARRPVLPLRASIDGGSAVQCLPYVVINLRTAVPLLAVFRQGFRQAHSHSPKHSVGGCVGVA